jgi:hypothetical protein
LFAAVVFGASVDESWILKTLGGVTTAVVVVWTAFDLWFWRLLPTRLTKRPRLWGTWKAEMESHWSHPATREQRVSTKTIYLVISQTYSKITLTGRFDISDSWTLSAAVSERDDGGFELAYTYRNEAHATQRQHNPPHRGSVVLGVSTTPRTRLEGDYWTDRLSTGRIKTLGRSKKRYGSYADAAAGNYS